MEDRPSENSTRVRDDGPKLRGGFPT